MDIKKSTGSTQSIKKNCSVKSFSEKGSVYELISCDNGQ